MPSFKVFLASWFGLVIFCQLLVYWVFIKIQNRSNYYDQYEWELAEVGVAMSDIWTINRAGLFPEAVHKLNENTCKPPIQNPFSKEMLAHFVPYTRNCSHSTYRKFYFRSKMTRDSYWITEFRRCPDHLKCCWEPLHFTNEYPYRPENRRGGQCVAFSGKSAQVPTDSEYVIIKCWNMKNANDSLSPREQKRLPVDHFELLFFVSKPSREMIYMLNRFRRQKFPKTNTEKPLNVLIYGLDTVSRGNFIRLMPETLEFLRSPEINAIDLQGFNKMGDATLNNTLGLMAGMNFSQAVKLQRNKLFFDDIPWLWNNFTEHGYLTGWGDDQISVFDYRFNGFLRQPTDIYLQPFIKWYFVRNQKFGPNYDCIGNDLAIDLLADHAKKTSIAMGDHPYFQFLWNSRVHEYPGYVSLLDKGLLDLLQDFNRSGALNKTLIVLTSDHGWRAGSIMANRQARIENRQSFAFLLLPKWFQEKYSEAYSNLVENQFRLTSPYDVHATLLDILNTSQLENQVIYEKAWKSSPGMSLFHPIPKTRTCQQAGIDPEWCACTNFLPFNASSPIAIQLGKFAVSQLNSWLVPFPSCVVYKLDKVLDAQVEVPRGTYSPGVNLSQANQFRISFGVFPPKTGPQFEVTIFTEAMYWLDGDPHKIKMSEEVFRLTFYGSESCIDVYSLKKICTCRIKPSPRN